MRPSFLFHYVKAASTRISTRLKSHIFYLDSCGRVSKFALECIFKTKFGFGVRIHWFHVDRRVIRVKRLRFKNIHFRVDVA